MKLNVDRETDALYPRLDDSPVVESEEVSPGVVLDYNESNEVAGVECSISPNAPPTSISQRCSSRLYSH